MESIADDDVAWVRFSVATILSLSNGENQCGENQCTIDRRNPNTTDGRHPNITDLGDPHRTDWFHVGVLLVSQFNPLLAAQAIVHYEENTWGKMGGGGGAFHTSLIPDVFSHAVHVILEEEHPDVFHALLLCHESLHVLVTRWRHDCFFGTLPWEDIALYVSLALLHGWEYQGSFSVILVLSYPLVLVSSLSPLVFVSSCLCSVLPLSNLALVAVFVFV
jgi:hypothetical protein